MNLVQDLQILLMHRSVSPVLVFAERTAQHIPVAYSCGFLVFRRFLSRVVTVSALFAQRVSHWTVDVH